MCPFWEYAERNPAFQYINGFVDYLLILFHCIEAVALTHDGHHFKECEYAGQLAVPEYVGTGNKHFGFAVDGECNQSIHQCIRVVRGEDYGSVRRNILFSYMQYAAV